MERRVSMSFVSLSREIAKGLTWDHGQGIAHGDEVGLCVLARNTELARILAEDRDVLPSETGKALSGDLAERRRQVDEVDMLEILLDVDESRHRLDVVPSLCKH